MGNTKINMTKETVFLWLLTWYQNHCDGDWEHGNGIHIDTRDNPGWSVSINIENTEFEHKKFDKISIDRSQIDWLCCFVKENKFKGRCGIKNLPEILHVFRFWAEASEDQSK